MKRLTALVLALVAASAIAALTPEQTRDRDVILGLYAKTVRCMVAATKAFQRHSGVTASSSITSFTLDVCAAPLRNQLVQRAGWTRADADAFLRSMAERAFEESY